MNQDRWEDFCRFHRYQVEWGDVDPVYPVLRQLGERWGLDDEQRLWLTFLHVAYYHLGSAVKAFHLTDGVPSSPYEIAELPCGTERRGHRTPAKLLAHLSSLADRAESAGGLGIWLRPGRTGRTPVEAWSATGALISGVYGNGRWATFKTLEMLAEINGFMMVAPDMDHANSSGPRHGLELLFPGLPSGNDRRTVAGLDHLSTQLVNQLRSEGLRATIENTETTLCDFHALSVGRYYVGHDVDVMLEQITAVPDTRTEISQLRWQIFPHWMLGELGGWAGVRPHLNRLYARTGQLEWWET